MRPSLPQRPSAAGLLQHPAPSSEIRTRKGAADSNMTDLTPLDKTLERIGLGRYQLRLLILCGFGWMADNMWLQCIAVILPRVQEHFAITDRWIGTLSASIFSGMMVGAWAWGSYSDSFGRTTAFNGTLLLTSIFGLLAGFAPTFSSLCFLLFFLGIGVGGSMPVDGTLFLENIPRHRHYLLTALSTFFSMGAVVTSALALAIIPGHSCPEIPPIVDGRPRACDFERENIGWRIQLRVLGVLTLIMFLCRSAFFRLHESPKWLVGAGRTDDAVLALRAIVQTNGEPFALAVADVIDTPCDESKDVENGYAAIDRSPSPPGTGFGDYTPVATNEHNHEASLSPVHVEARLPHPWVSALPESIATRVSDYLNHVGQLFSPQWARTTILLWCIWTLVSAGYTIFNVFLPKWLEYKVGVVDGGRLSTLREYLLYTLAGCPGSIIGAYLAGTTFGQHRSMAIATLATAAGIILFVQISSQTAVVFSSAWISLMATLMYALLYSYTPAVFPVALRGTGCGIASALSRLAGILAPLITGTLLALSVSLPLFVSALVFLASAVCMFALPSER